MCGRYSLASAPEELVEAFDLPNLDFELVARYNVAPGQEAPIVGEDERGRRAGLMRWGFAASWQDRPGSGFVNARAESVASKPSFREAFRRRRCLVPIDGFYEWRDDDGRKTPFWLHPRQGGVVSLAGIWERWERPGVDPRYGFAILTTDASADVVAIHDRMPVVVSPEDRDVWLDRDATEASLRSLLRPAPAGSFLAHEVSTRVNRPDEDDPALVEPV